MSGQPHDANATFDQPSEPSLTRQFEDAWRIALKGGSPPSLDGVLAQAPEAQRLTLRSELTRIEGEYRPRRATQFCSLAAAAVLQSAAAVPTDPKLPR